MLVSCRLFSRATYDSKFTFEVITIAYSANAAAALRKLMQRLSPQMQAICRMIQPCSRGLPLSVVLKSGALQAHGELLLVAPADGSIKMSELMHLEKASLTSGWKTPLVVLGQRRPKLRQNLASKLHQHAEGDTSMLLDSTQDEWGQRQMDRLQAKGPTTPQGR